MEASPFNTIYPESILKSADIYFKAQMGLYKKGVIAEKEAHLVAIGTSAAIKCQYCIPYHISELKRLGASEDEIKNNGKSSAAGPPRRDRAGPPTPTLPSASSRSLPTREGSPRP